MKRSVRDEGRPCGTCARDCSDDATRTPCEHQFCTGCFLTHVLSQLPQTATCPSCNASVESYHRERDGEGEVQVTLGTGQQQLASRMPPALSACLLDSSADSAAIALVSARPCDGGGAVKACVACALDDAGGHCTVFEDTCTLLHAKLVASGASSMPDIPPRLLSELISAARNDESTLTRTMRALATGRPGAAPAPADAATLSARERKELLVPYAASQAVQKLFRPQQSTVVSAYVESALRSHGAPVSTKQLLGDLGLSNAPAMKSQMDAKKHVRGTAEARMPVLEKFREVLRELKHMRSCLQLYFDNFGFKIRGWKPGYDHWIHLRWTEILVSFQLNERELGALAAWLHQHDGGGAGAPAPPAAAAAAAAAADPAPQYAPLDKDYELLARATHTRMTALVEVETVLPSVDPEENRMVLCPAAGGDDAGLSRLALMVEKRDVLLTEQITAAACSADAGAAAEALTAAVAFAAPTSPDAAEPHNGNRYRDSVVGTPHHANLALTEQVHRIVDLAAAGFDEHSPTVMVDTSTGEVESHSAHEAADDGGGRGDWVAVTVPVVCGCDGQPAETAQDYVTRASLERKVFILNGPFHLLLKAFNMRGRLFAQSHLLEITLTWRTAPERANWVLFPGDPKEAVKELPSYICGMYTSAIRACKVVLTRAPSASEVHEHMIARALRFPLAAVVLLELRFAEIIMILVRSERLGGFADARSAERLLTMMFCVAHATGYINIAASNAEAWAAASPVLRKFIEADCFTRPTAWGKPTFSDLSVEKDIRDWRTFLGKFAVPGMEDVVYSLAADLPQLLMVRRDRYISRRREKPPPPLPPELFNTVFCCTLGAADHIGLWGSDAVLWTLKGEQILEGAFVDAGGGALSKALVDCPALGEARFKQYCTERAAVLGGADPPAVHSVKPGDVAFAQIATSGLQESDTLDYATRKALIFSAEEIASGTWLGRGKNSSGGQIKRAWYTVPAIKDELAYLRTLDLPAAAQVALSLPDPTTTAKSDWSKRLSSVLILVYPDRTRAPRETAKPTSVQDAMQHKLYDLPFARAREALTEADALVDEMTAEFLAERARDGGDVLDHNLAADEEEDDMDQADHFDGVF